jgi:hypothetical protein
MANEVTDQQAPSPPAGLRVLDPLVGRWKISGGSEGETTYEWMDGGFFQIQRGEVTRDGERFGFLQIIGYERSPDGKLADDITGRLYTTRGESLGYVCEADAETLTIWFGEKGSPARYQGRWSDDGNTITGAWEWPGGGYEETMTRLG